MAGAAADGTKSSSSSKTKKNAGGGSAVAEVESLSQPSLSGVLVAFSTPEDCAAFEPLATDLPPCLLPVSGIPLVEYAVEFLIQNGCSHVVVLLRDDAAGSAVFRVVSELQQRMRAKQLKQTQRQQQRIQTLAASAGVGAAAVCAAAAVSSQSSSLPHIETILLPVSVRTVADALRDLSSLCDLRSSFLLMSATTMAVGSIRPAIDAHLARVNGTSGGGPSPCLTCLAVSVPPTARQRSLGDDACVVIDPQTNQLLAREPLADKRHVALGSDVLDKCSGGTLSVRYDLVFPELFICAPSVLRLMEESFDLTTVWPALVSHLLQKDLQLHAVHCYVLERSAQPADLQTTTVPPLRPYLLTARDVRLYGSILRDVLERWAYPVVLDSHAMERQRYLKYRGRGVYQAASVTAAVESDIGPLAALEEDCVIGERSRIQGSFLSRGCVVGSDCLVRGSVLLEGCVVQDGAVVEDALLGPFCVVKKKAVVQGGALLAERVVVGEGVTLPPKTRAFNPQTETQKAALQERQNKRLDGAADQDEEQPEHCEEKEGRTRDDSTDADAREASALGADGVGCLYSPEDVFLPAGAVEPLFLGEDIRPKIKLPLPRPPSADDCESSGSEWLEREAGGSSDDEEDAGEKDLLEGGPFAEEIAAMTLEALQQPSVAQHKVLEMKSFRLSCNKTDADVSAVVFECMLKQLVFAAPPSKAEFVLFKASEEAEPERRRNPFAGPCGFCQVCEMLRAADFFEVEASLPRWAEAAGAAAQKEDKTETSDEALLAGGLPPSVLATFLAEPRFQAFVRWLGESEEEDESDSEDSKDGDQ